MFMKTSLAVVVFVVVVWLVGWDEVGWGCFWGVFLFWVCVVSFFAAAAARRRERKKRRKEETAATPPPPSSPSSEKKLNE
jgi:Na+/melibiose symporter-like transporter